MSTPTTITGLRARYQPLPLRHRFVLSIRSAEQATLIRWELELSDGRSFLGESVPVQYVTGETVDSVLGLQPAIHRAVVGWDALRAVELCQLLTKQFPDAPAARAGVEIALMKAWSSCSGTSLHDHFGAKLQLIETDITISKVPDALPIAQGYHAEGYRIFKTKVGGGDVAGDLERLTQLHHGLRDASFRLDANQGFDPDAALFFVEQLIHRGVRIELLEQPVPKEDIPALDFVAARSPVPIIADEACRTPNDAAMLCKETAVQGINVKVMKAGLTGALEIMNVTKQAGKQLMIGCMIESPIALAMSVALATGSGQFRYCDLDGHDLIALEPPYDGFEAIGPILRSTL